MNIFEVNNITYECILIGDKRPTTPRLAKSSYIYYDQEKNLIIKKVYRFLEYDVFYREIYWLKKLSKFNWVPRLIDYDSNQNLMILSYCGVPINKKNIPSDYNSQINQIVDDLKTVDCRHNDIKQGEILVNQAKIYLCDFGMASLLNDFTINGLFTKKIPEKFKIKDDLIQLLRRGIKP